jgi:glycerol-3-phosphate cytidylyltransferase-like family protein
VGDDGQIILRITHLMFVQRAGRVIERLWVVEVDEAQRGKLPYVESGEIYSSLQSLRVVDLAVCGLLAMQKQRSLAQHPSP